MRVKRALFTLWAVAIAGALAAAAPEPPPGAPQCTGCHAASPKVDSAIPRIAGRSAADIIAQMQAFKTGQKHSTVMERIAKGFSDEEIVAIAQWYAQVTRRP